MEHDEDGIDDNAHIVIVQPENPNPDHLLTDN